MNFTRLIFFILCFSFLQQQAAVAQRATAARLEIRYEEPNYIVGMDVLSASTDVFPLTFMGASQVSIVTPGSVTIANNNVNSQNGGLWSISPGATTTLVSSSDRVTAISTTGAPIPGAGVGFVPLFTINLSGGCNDDIRLFDNGEVTNGDGNFNNNLDVVQSGDIYNDNNVNLVNCSAFPVELTFFTAEAQPDETAMLTWQTATEINNDLFEIEHSLDGVTFERIGKEKGAGTTDVVQDYDFLHRNPASGTNYYRLKQIDFDGSFEYSDVEVVSFDRESAGSTGFNVYPNPAVDYVMIDKAGRMERHWDVDIFDIGGRLISSFTLREDNYRLNTSDWAAGVYQIRLKSENRTEQIRFVKD